MILKRRLPGEPLVVLALILAGWVGARVLAWEVVFDGVGAEQSEQAAHLAVTESEAGGTADAGTARFARSRNVREPDARAPGGRVPGYAERDFAAPLMALPRVAAPLEVPQLFAPVLSGPIPGEVIPGEVVPPPLPIMPDAPPFTPAVAPRPDFGPRTVNPGTMAAAPADRIMVAGGHQLLWLAATAYLPLPPLGLRTAPDRPAAPALPARRWSGDGWLLLRRGDGRIAPGPVVGNYGASQMGAVLRYRLAATDPHRPAAYVRATAALNGTREQQVAAGLSARPLPRIPLTAMAELRQVRDSAGERLRPAVALVTELPPRRLPLGFTGELYAQAGYVGGRHPTAFVDGLVRAERPLADLAGFRLRAGGGAWGAKQRGAARVDVGPTASLSFRLTDTASARLAADWRFRVGGRSKPDSGPALTLSAGF